MASILNPKISATVVSDSPDTWDIVVQYDAVFSAFELANFDFRDGFILWEHDGLGQDDQLTGVAAVAVFNPSVSPTHRTMKLKISGNSLDTELGKETIFATIRLRNLPLNQLYTKNTGTIVISP